LCVHQESEGKSMQKFSCKQPIAQKSLVLISQSTIFTKKKTHQKNEISGIGLNFYLIETALIFQSFSDSKINLSLSQNFFYADKSMST
jgi:hypothetical protein